MYTEENLNEREWEEIMEIAKERDIHFDPTTTRADLTQRILDSLSPDREGEPVATAVASPPTGDISSVSIGEDVTVDPDIDVPVEPEVTYSFWVGTTEECPFQNVTLGITFPRFVGAFQGLDEAQDPIPPDTRGVVVKLSPEEFEMVKKKVANTVVRSAGRKSILKSKTSKRYRPMVGDTPVGRYLFMRRIGAGMRYDFVTDQPEPMVKHADGS